MERIGLKVDMQQMDWSTLVARRAKKEPPSQGGWNALLTAAASVDIVNPLVNSMTNAACDGAWFGWACDSRLVELRTEFARATDPAKQKEIVEAIQLRIVEYPTHIFLGEWNQPIARRTSISGNIESAVTVFWNIEKKK
jgi:peptide/nickel transport system substrate-binding protein